VKLEEGEGLTQTQWGTQAWWRVTLPSLVRSITELPHLSVGLCPKIQPTADDLLWLCLCWADVFLPLFSKHHHILFSWYWHWIGITSTQGWFKAYRRMSVGLTLHCFPKGTWVRAHFGFLQGSWSQPLWNYISSNICVIVILNYAKFSWNSNLPGCLTSLASLSITFLSSKLL
jgi:hypothetical protein